MWKLLIVEDEPGIFHLIDKSIEYSEHNLELVGYANSGSQALSLMAVHKPDIVITDISMPGLSGLDFIEMAQKKGYHARFIIISGYAQFEFAQTALKLGVENYLIKPINSLELNHTLAQIIRSLAFEKGISVQTLHLHTSYRRKQIRSSFLQKILYEHITPEDLQLNVVNHDFMYSFTPGLFQLAVLHLDYAEETLLGMKNYLSYHISSLLEDFLQSKCMEFETAVHNDNIFVIANFEQTQSNYIQHIFHQGFMSVMEFLSDYSGIFATLCLGSYLEDIADIPDSLKEIVFLLHARILCGTNQILLFDQFDHTPLTSAEQKYIIPDKSYTLLKTALRHRDAYEISQVISDIFSEVLQFCTSHPQWVLQIADAALLQLLASLRQDAYFHDDLMPTYQQFGHAMKSFFRTQDFTIHLPDILTQFLLTCAPEDEPENSNQIQIILDYIDQNISQNLKLEDVADQVYLSPAYLGILFKKETGENFTSYVTKLRLTKAKELLMDVRLNISEIAVLVGYKNSRYFSRIFKENIGITPKEYRNIHTQKNFHDW